MSKALLIRSYEEKKGGEQGKWNKLDQTPSYIQGIETGKILDDMSADKLGALISGVPTPWARAKLFRFALQTLSTPDPNINQAGLLQLICQTDCGEDKTITALQRLSTKRLLPLLQTAS